LAHSAWPYSYYSPSITEPGLLGSSVSKIPITRQWQRSSWQTVPVFFVTLRMAKKKSTPTTKALDCVYPTNPAAVKPRKLGRYSQEKTFFTSLKK
jgi:hypothetical protein